MRYRAAAAGGCAMSGPQKITRQARTAGRPIASSESGMRTQCKVCHRTIYGWQATVWRTGAALGLCHADPKDCEE